LMYFMQEAGEELKLQHAKGPYGRMPATFAMYCLLWKGIS